MKIIASSFYYVNAPGENYKELADRTIRKNLKDYCDRHGYEYLPFFLDEIIEGTPYEIACRACLKNSELILQTLQQRSDCEWFWHRDCDALITNPAITLESIIEANPGIEIITGSDKAGISMGQVLVKNTERTRLYFYNLCQAVWCKRYEHEQKYMWGNPVDFLKATPQNVMNSYDCESRLEPPDTPGNWNEGDFIIHLAGLNLAQKMSVLDKWMGKVK